MTASGVVVSGGGIKQKGIRTHGCGQQCGDCYGEVGMRGLNGNVKKYNKGKKEMYTCKKIRFIEYSVVVRT